MLNKEEIEKAKGWLSALDIKSEYEAISKEIILNYIDQLESEIKEVTSQRNELATDLSDKEDDKQELIEKLEEDIKYGKKFKSDLPTIPEIRAKYAQEILSIMKGEKE